MPDVSTTKKNCRLKPTCHELRKLMRKIGVSKGSISSDCNGHHPCQGAFDNVTSVTRNLNVDNANHVSDFVRMVFDGELPIERSTVALRQILYREPFYCGEIDTEIQQPCQVTSCAYWTDNDWTRNCILFYLLDQHRPSLDIKEMAFLLGRPSSELRRRTNAVTAELRHWALKHKTAQQEDHLPVRIVEEEQCMACGHGVQDATPTYHQGFCYCGPDCIDKKPPLDLQIEQDFRLTIERVLQICVDSFGAKRPICHALNVTARELDELCDRYDVSTTHLQ